MRCKLPAHRCFRFCAAPHPHHRGAARADAAAALCPVIDGMREAIDKRIRAVLPGDKGTIASALITGKRDAPVT
jgi:hypothetical protein